MNTEQQLFALMAAADTQQQAVSELIAAQQQQAETLAQQQQRQPEWERSSREALITLAGNNQHHLRVLVQTHQTAVEEATKQALTKAWTEADAQYLKVLESQFKHLQAQVHDSIKETQAAASYIGRYARWLRFRLAWFLGVVTLAVVLTILISLWVTVDKERQYLAELGQQRQQLQLEVGQ